MKFSPSIQHLLILLLLPLLATACEDAKDLLSSDDDGKAAQAVSSSTLSLTESSLILALSNPADLSSSSADEVAASIAALVDTTFQPAGCAQALTTGPLIGYTFDKCSGPFGLAEVSGQASATFALDNDTLTLNLIATGLKSNGASMTINVHAIITTPGETDERSLELTTTGVGTLPSGTTVARAGSYTLTFEETGECVVINGAWTTTVDEDESESWVTAASDFKRCGSSCAESGTISLTSSKTEETTVVTFDGSNRPLFSSTDKLIPSAAELECTPVSN